MPRIIVLPHEELCPGGAVIEAKTGESICAFPRNVFTFPLKAASVPSDSARARQSWFHHTQSR